MSRGSVLAFHESVLAYHDIYSILALHYTNISELHDIAFRAIYSTRWYNSRGPRFDPWTDLPPTPRLVYQWQIC